MAIYDTQPSRINANGRRFIWLVSPVGILYIAAIFLYRHYPHNGAIFDAVLITGIYILVITSWFGLIRREIPTVFPGRFGHAHMTYGGEAIFQSILIALFVIALYAL